MKHAMNIKIHKMEKFLVGMDVSRHFRNKKKAYLKAKIEELETNSKIKNVRDMASMTSRWGTSLELI
jgi:hypothetical protein